MKQFFTLAFAALAFAMNAQVAPVTWNVNMANEEVSPDGVFLAGGDYFGTPGENAMTDDDGDGVWTITMAMPLGYSGAYTFTNGACGDWACKENIVGQDCAYGTWSDRFLDEVTAEGATISTCFAQCTSDGSCASVSAADVTFRVDMTEQIVTGGVFLHAAFDGWGAIAMNDDDGDNVYETTQTLETGSYEYLFQNGEGGNEAFDSTYVECTLTSGDFTNRLITVENDSFATEAFCFNSCSACESTGGGDSTYTVTFNVNMANEEVSPEGVYIAGGGNFGNPGDNEMLDADGDGIYSATFTFNADFSSFYTFTNGACGDYSCKENLTGLPCGDPDSFNDRFLDPLTQNTTVSTCFGQCTTDGSCETSSEIPVTFRVDMSDQVVISDVTIFGSSVNGWSFPGELMTDDDGDGIYEYSTVLAPGGHEYKFVNSGVDEQFDAENYTECTLTTGDFTNRILTIEAEESITTEAYCFNSCAACEGSTGIAEALDFDFQLIPSVTSGNVELRFAGVQSPKQITIVSFTGALVASFQVPANENVYAMDVSGQAAGVYFVQVQAEGLGLTQKLLKVN
ncbi:T9SS type A sorting domain-containing protein [Flavobacteriales bacterium]|nr:T9SS type A sorting domain-containing protein [Flavobacteriales bacterium]